MALRTQLGEPRGSFLGKLCVRQSDLALVHYQSLLLERLEVAGGSFAGHDCGCQRVTAVHWKRMECTRLTH